jgi:hypothetical protein
MTRSIDNPAARMEATSWSTWDQSYEVGPPYWIHAQSAPTLTDVIPMLLMLASHTACVAGVWVINAGRLMPKVGPDVVAVVGSAVVVVVVEGTDVVVVVVVVLVVVAAAGLLGRDTKAFLAASKGVAVGVTVVVVEL